MNKHLFHHVRYEHSFKNEEVPIQSSRIRFTRETSEWDAQITSHCSYFIGFLKMTRLKPSMPPVPHLSFLHFFAICISASHFNSQLSYFWLINFLSFLSETLSNCEPMEAGQLAEAMRRFFICCCTLVCVYATSQTNPPTLWRSLIRRRKSGWLPRNETQPSIWEVICCRFLTRFIERERLRWRLEVLTFAKVCEVVIWIAACPNWWNGCERQISILHQYI